MPGPPSSHNERASSSTTTGAGANMYIRALLRWAAGRGAALVAGPSQALALASAAFASPSFAEGCFLTAFWARSRLSAASCPQSVQTRGRALDNIVQSWSGMPCDQVEQGRRPGKQAGCPAGLQDPRCAVLVCAAAPPWQPWRRPRRPCALRPASCASPWPPAPSPRAQSRCAASGPCPAPCPAAGLGRRLAAAL